MLRSQLFKTSTTNKNNNKNTYIFVLWTLIIHLILLWGVLDINFHSPIIQGLPVIPAPEGAPAKRLILFVADGLRFRTFTENLPPYLRSLMNNQSVWGISHTRVPTESRPGNVAIAAGLYEDPSAIFKGWKENPVDFDSVFNESQLTWAWGSPDIIPIFTKDNKSNIQGKSYPSKWQDFAALQDDMMRLDAWVFDRYLEWLVREASTFKTQDGIIFFLHLLGCDTIGHSRKPYSREYVENLKYIDRRIEDLVQKTERFFGDESTAYVFTADHGMSDWGSHGSGSTDETETPLIVWGKGVNSNGGRYDVNQADIAPLISTLVGRPIPTNNEGVLPQQYLSDNDSLYKSQALLNNLKQLVYQVKGNRMLVSGNDENLMDPKELELDKRISKISRDLESGKLSEGIKETQEAIILAKEYLFYFRQYQRTQFLTYLSLMWCSWIVYLFLKVVGQPRKQYKFSLLLVINYGCTILLVVLIFKCAVSKHKNWRQLFYSCFATISLWLAAQSFLTLTPNIKIQSFKKCMIEITGILFLLFTIFIGLTYRAALSIGMLFTVLMQQLLVKKTNSYLIWSGLFLTIFPLLPVVEPYPRIYIVLTAMFINMCKIVLTNHSKQQKIFEMGRLSITGLVYLKIIDGKSWVSWLILASVPSCIWNYTENAKDRIDGIVFSLFCPLLLLSASYEPLFFLVLATNLLLLLESVKNPYEMLENRIVNTEDFMKAAFVIFYTLLCFFGTGNMASISSFDPTWTQHFITVFSPFIMCSLIIFKLSIPLLLLGCVSHIFYSPKVFIAVLLLGDCLSLPLVFCVNAQGSWLDIGSAISRFVIAISLPCLLLVLYYLSFPLMKFNLKKQGCDILLEKKHIV